jgi:hypothetical protein
LLLVRFSQLVSDFIEASRNFISSQKESPSKNCENRQRFLQKVLAWLLGPLKKYSSRRTVPLKGKFKYAQFFWLVFFNFH